MKAIYAHLAGSIALTASLSACVPASQPPTTGAGAAVREAVQQTVPTPVTTRPAAEIVSELAYDSYLDVPQTPGTWSYRGDRIESFADFKSPDGQIVFQVNCFQDRRIFLMAAADNLGGGFLDVQTETTRRRLTADAREGWLVSVLDNRDTLLDAMAITKGRFAVGVDGGPTFYIPAWAELSRVIEDCR
jgi:hypothetical protein